MKKQFLKKPLWITREEMAGICKPCAAKMEQKNIAKVNLSVLDADLKVKFLGEEISDDDKKAAMSLHGNEVEKCVEKVDGVDGISDAESFCASLVARIHKIDDEFFFSKSPEDILFQLESKKEKLKIHGYLSSSDKTGAKFEVVLISEGLTTDGYMSNGLPAKFTSEFLSNPEVLAKFEKLSRKGLSFRWSIAALSK